MLRKSVTLEFKLPSRFSFVYAFFMPHFHHMAITHHILRKTWGGTSHIGQYVGKKDYSMLLQITLPREIEQKLLFAITQKIKMNKV